MTSPVAFWAAVARGADPWSNPMSQYHILRRRRGPSGWSCRGRSSGGPSIHFDIHTDDLEAEVERLEGLARPSSTPWADHPGSWVIMRDPAGMEFCVVWALNPLRPQTIATTSSSSEEVGIGPRRLVGSRP